MTRRSDLRNVTTTGRVSLVGAGPGDPDLLTVKALSRIQRAHVVLHDRLVDQRILDLVPPRAERLDVGKYPADNADERQRRIHLLMADRAARGKRIVRLKGGDPYVFGRGGEELAAMRELGIEVEVVPGVSSVVAAPGSVGIPLTMRGLSDSFGVFTARHSADATREIDWRTAATIPTTVFLMGVAELATITTELSRAGRSPETPVAVIERATTSRQRAWYGTIDTIVNEARDARSPAAIVVGEVVRLADGWPMQKPAGHQHTPNLEASA